MPETFIILLPNIPSIWFTFSFKTTYLYAPFMSIEYILMYVINYLNSGEN